MLLWRREDFSSYQHFDLLTGGELATLAASRWDECSLPTRRTKALLDVGPKKDEGWWKLPGLLLQQPESPGFSFYEHKTVAGHMQEAGRLPRFPSLPPFSPTPPPTGSAREGLAGPDTGWRQLSRQIEIHLWELARKIRDTINAGKSKRRQRFLFLKCRSGHGIPLPIALH